MKGDLNFKTLFPDSFRRVVEWNTVARATPPTIEEQEKIVLEEIKELSTAVDEEDLKEVVDALADIFFTAAYLEELSPDNPLVDKSLTTLLSGINCLGHAVVTDAILEVVESNYTKFVNIKKAPYVINQDSVTTMVKTEEKVLSVRYGLEVIGYLIGDYVVFRDENNKVKKPFTYIPPDIESVIERHLNIKNKEEILAKI